MFHLTSTRSLISSLRMYAREIFSWSFGRGLVTHGQPDCPRWQPAAPEAGGVLQFGYALVCRHGKDAQGQGRAAFEIPYWQGVVEAAVLKGRVPQELGHIRAGNMKPAGVKKLVVDIHPYLLSYLRLFNIRCPAGQRQLPGLDLGSVNPSVQRRGCERPPVAAWGDDALAGFVRGHAGYGAGPRLKDRQVLGRSRASDECRPAIPCRHSKGFKRVCARLKKLWVEQRRPLSISSADRKGPGASNSSHAPIQGQSDKAEFLRVERAGDVGG